MRPLRVVHVVNRLALGGMEYNVVKLLNRLDRSRFAPAICSLGVALPNARALLAPDVPSWEMNRREGRDLGLILRLARRFEAEGIDVVHSHNWSTFLYSVAAARLAGVKVVLQGEHGLEVETLVETPMRRRARRVVSPWTDHYVGVSREICERIAGWGVSWDRITFIPNGVDLARFGIEYDTRAIREALGIAPTDPTVVAIGAFRPVKDFGTLLHAFALVQRARPDARLLLVGSDIEDRYRQLMQAESAHLGAAAGRVRHLGIRMDTAELLAASDVYVNSSLYEGMSNTILEAMASRKPVVATGVGGTPDLVTHGSNGLLVPPRDPEALAGAVLEVLSDPERAAAMGALGRGLVERKHSFTRMISLNADLYEVLHDRKTRSFTAVGRVKMAVSWLCRAAGLTGAAERRDPGSLIILTYHRVLPLAMKRRSPSQAMILSCEVFDRQMEMLRRRYPVLSLEEVLDHYRNRRPFPPLAVHVTFDDGYADNHAYALPILDEHSVPATIFLATGPIDSGGLLWWDELGQALLCLRGRRPERGGDALGRIPEALRWPLQEIFAGHGNPVPLIDRCTRILNRHEEATRRGVAAALAALAEPYREAPVPRLMLTWEQVREMQRARFSLGGHTVRHVFLSELDDTAGREEVRQCLTRIEAESGVRPRAFSYPAGRVDERSRPWFAEAGVELAMTTRAGRNRSGDDRFALRRWDASYLAVEDRFVRSRMRLELSGMMDWAARFRTYEAVT